jgi:hypothetical protein
MYVLHYVHKKCVCVTVFVQKSTSSKASAMSPTLIEQADTHAPVVLIHEHS